MTDNKNFTKDGSVNLYPTKGNPRVGKIFENKSFLMDVLQQN